MPEILNRYANASTTQVELTFPRKNFINKIIIGNHSPLRRHVRCFADLRGSLTPTPRIPEATKRHVRTLCSLFYTSKELQTNTFYNIDHVDTGIAH